MNSRTRNSLLLLAHVACVAACAPKKLPPPVFIPEPPIEPRLQVLLTINTEADISGSDPRTNALLGRRDATKSLAKPYGAVMRGSRIYISDSGLGKIVVADLVRKRFESLDGDAGMGKLKKPINLTVDGEGTLYVTDTGRKQVLAYDRRGRHVRSYGDGSTMKPSGVAVRGERVYVSDIKSHQILILDRKTGKQLKRFGGPGVTAGKTSFPANLTLDAQGNVYTSEALTGRVQKFTSDGEFLQQFSRQGVNTGELARPKGVAVDRDGNVYVADANTAFVQIFDKQGRLLLFFGGEFNRPGGLFLPAGVSLTYDKESIETMQQYAAPDFKLKYLVIVVSQYGTRRVTIFGFGERVKTGVG